MRPWSDYQIRWEQAGNDLEVGGRLEEEELGLEMEEWGGGGSKWS